MHQILLPVATRMCFAGMAPFHPDDGIFLSGTALFIRTTAFFIRNEFIRTTALFPPDEKIFSSGTALFIRTMALFHPERHFFIRTTALFLRTKPATASGTPHTTSIPSSMHGQNLIYPNKTNAYRLTLRATLSTVASIRRKRHAFVIWVSFSP